MHGIFDITEVIEQIYPSRHLLNSSKYHSNVTKPDLKVSDREPSSNLIDHRLLTPPNSYVHKCTT